ncbi:MAG: ribbon-helix-helix protein, CopG family [Anaerolineae bacterium]|nr:ribbon-helix-helix protein, CopG family [Anaerolineae bacterium]
MATKTVRRSISMTPEMRDLLAQIAAKRGREVNENDIIRDAIRQYLDQQADVVGSRRHFQRSLQARLDRLENTLTFQMLMLTFLLATVLGDEGDEAIHEAMTAALRNGEALLKEIAALRPPKANI